jgi:hypothetical protein
VRRVLDEDAFVDWSIAAAIIKISRTAPAARKNVRFLRKILPIVDLLFELFGELADMIGSLFPLKVQIT